MAGIIDKSKNERTTTVLLNRKAFAVLQEVKRQDPKFNFSAYASRRIIQDYKKIDEVAIIAQQITNLAIEEDEYKKDTAMKREILLKRLQKTREKKNKNENQTKDDYETE